MKAANEKHTSIFNEAALTQAVASHLDPDSREPSCFLSVFTTKVSANSWARKLHDRLEEEWEKKWIYQFQHSHLDDRVSPGFPRQERVYITRVMTPLLPPSAQVFDAAALCERLGIHREHSKNELLFLECIPWHALGRTRDFEIGAPTRGSVAAEVRSVQDLNDSHGELLGLGDTAGDLLRSTGDENGAENARMLAIMHTMACRSYQEAMKNMVSMMVEMYYATKAPGQKVKWNTREPFVELFLILCFEHEQRRGQA
jgi:hypothetical protein